MKTEQLNENFTDLFPCEDRLVIHAGYQASHSGRFGTRELSFCIQQVKNSMRLKEEDIIFIQGVLRNYAREYQKYVRPLIENYPLTVGAYWENFRRNSRVPPLRIFPHPDLDNDENDVILRSDLQQIIKGEAALTKGEFHTLDEPVCFEFLAFDPKAVFGVGRYIFKDNAGFPVCSVWDLANERVPTFRSF